MSANSYQVLLVGDMQLDRFADQKAATRPSDNQIQFLRVSTYPVATQFVQYGHWDAILVLQDFDSHPGLEFIHHARLLDSRTPIILLCDAYDDDLDYKAQKIGATDSVCIDWVNAAYLNRQFVPEKALPSYSQVKTRPISLLKRFEGFLSLF